MYSPAIEILTAARALDLRAPIAPADATGAVVSLLRETVPGPGPDRHLAPEIAAVAALVVAGHHLAHDVRRYVALQPQVFLQTITDQSAQDVGRTARGKRHHQGDGLGWVARLCEGLVQGRQGAGCGQAHHLASIELHGVLSC